MNLENININEDIEIDDGMNKSIISKKQEDVSKASNKYNNDEMLKCLVKWIIVNQHSFTIVEEPAFADLIYTLQSDAKLISADTVKRKIIDLYESNINKVKESFKNITGKISFTIDIWTSLFAKSFLSLTAHYINDNWNVLNSLALSGKDLKNFIITDDEWSELEKVKLFLEKFKKITVLMFGSLYSTLLMLISLYNALIDHMEDYISKGEEKNEEEDGNENEDKIGNDNEESTIKKAAMNC
ncbi:hypothetical protein RclHR1_08960003 [Rhizophagus clarus]|uniref:hAT-like transposase RNase-H fold domain-containing protein n=1 Tax=Rhizophagus clarus TaxID=94130 RepID=A0A2Z6S2S4_9GLOM|nr:hypothetical protein RclHR1_08960003 [Rhizophagus clarus]